MHSLKKSLVILGLASASTCAIFSSFVSSKKADLVLGDDYYAKVTDDMRGSTLQSTLHGIINNSSVSVSYDWSRFEAADEDPNNSNNIITIYARTSLSKSDHVSGSSGWNREHSFPQSKMTAAGAKSDNHIIFASDNKVNGKRSNYKLADHTGTTPNVYDYKGNLTPCIFKDSTFDPGDTIARGMVARSTFYSAAMYSFEVDENIESIETALRWHLTYAVSETDIRRNEIVYGNQHNRNPFVDHPSYACKIWGTSGTAKKICDELNGWTDNPEPSKKLSTLDITGTPNKTNYIEGETFDPTGLTVTATFDDESTSDVTSSVSWSSLSIGDTSVTGTYTYGGVTKTITVSGITVSSSKIDVTSVSISSVATNVETGDEVKLSVTVLPSNATDKSVKFKSSDESLATVDSSGNVEFLKAGKVTITATSNSNPDKSASKQFTITQKIIHVTQVNAFIIEGDHYVNDTIQIDWSVLPEDASNKSVTFKSSNSSVASVSESGLITCNALGNATFTVTSVDNSSAKQTLEINVVNRPAVPVTNIIVNQLTDDYFVGDTVQMEWTVIPSNATNKNVQFESEDENVVEVSKTGLVNCVGSGSTNINVYAQDGSLVEGITSILVKSHVSSVSLSEGEVTLSNGSYIDLEATVLPEDAFDKRVTWSTSDDEVASVDNNGRVTANSLGEARITVKTVDGNFVDYCDVTVIEEPIRVESISISPKEISITVGNENTLSVSVLPTNATNKEIHWSSSGDDIATVDQNGKVTGVSAGVTYVVATASDGGYTDLCKVIVSEAPVKELVEIAVTKSPNKTLYSVGEEFDISGLEVEAHYIDGTKEDISNKVEVGTVLTEVVGTFDVKVQYKTFETSFQILVSEDSLNNLKITKFPAKTTYFKSESFNPYGIEVVGIFGSTGANKDVTKLVKYEYDFENSNTVKIKLHTCTATLKVTVQEGEITNEHKAVNFAYVFSEKTNNAAKESVTIDTWKVLEYNFNTLSSEAKEILKKTVSKYGPNEVSAEDDTTQKLKDCVANYDEIYLAHTKDGFNDFMNRSPKTPTPTPQKSGINTVILIAIAAGAVALIILIIVIAVVASKKRKKKHA